MIMTIWKISIRFFIALCLFLIMVSLEAAEEGQKMKKVRFIIGINTVIATMYDNPAANEFLGQLPLSLFASKEKISYLPKKLSIERNTSREPAEGDIAYYAPWGNLAIFYKGTEAATEDLFILGKIDSEKTAFDVSGKFEVKVELVE